MNPTYWLLPVAAYLYGSVPFGFLMARRLKGVDIREVGSGNVGATNAARVLGWRCFPAVFLLDFSKGLLPTLAAVRLAGGAGAYDPHPLAVAAGLAAVLGHVFSVYLRFKGGKAVATGAGVFAVVAPWSLLVAALAWMAAFALWRYVSLASICAAGALAASAWAIYGDPLGGGLFRTALATLAALMVIALHRGNIKRLLAGAERRVGGRLKGGGASAP